MLFNVVPIKSREMKDDDDYTATQHEQSRTDPATVVFRERSPYTHNKRETIIQE